MKASKASESLGFPSLPVMVNDSEPRCKKLNKSNLIMKTGISIDSKQKR